MEASSDGTRIPNVPYVTAQDEVHEAASVMDSAFDNDIAVKPTSHVTHRTGGFSLHANRKKFVASLHEGAGKAWFSDALSR